MDILPGMNECEKGPSDACRVLAVPWQPLQSKKVILLATATINDGSLTFANTGSFGNGSNQISFGGGAIKYVAANKTD